MEVSVSAAHRPAGFALIRRGKTAGDYFTYCEEVGCDIWEQLLALAAPGEEPVCLWLPRDMIAPGTSPYVQGVLVPEDHPVPPGFEKIRLPGSDYLRFQGPPFEEADFGRAIEEVWAAMAAFDPAPLGYAWNDRAPRIQLEPRCERGYVELRAVKAV